MNFLNIFSNIFMAYIQMQERIRAEEKAVMERQMKDDIEKAEGDGMA